MARTVGIILIGNEILSGKIADANAGYLCRELRALGADVRRIVVVPDEVDVIARHIREFSESFDVVFTSGGVGPTHDDVTIEAVARAMAVPVVCHPRLVSLLEGFYKGRLTEARLRLADVPEGAALVGGDAATFPVVLVRNVYVLPGVPEIFRQKFEALKEAFRDIPYHLASVFVNMGESTLADHLNEVVRAYPDLLLGSYPEFLGAEYKVKVTLESKDRSLMERALADLLGRLPREALVRVER